MSILRKGNIDLDEYADWIGDYQAAVRVGNHLYNMYPIGASLLALPFVWLFDTLSGGAFADSLYHSWPIAQELIIACFIAALGAVVIFHIARLTLSLLPSLLVTFIFAFCTSAWSIFSRALWQHGPCMLMLALALYILFRARKHPGVVQYAGLFVALSYLMRPTNIFSVLILTLYVAKVYRPYLLRYLFWSACIAVPFIVFNLSVFQSPIAAYYLPHDSLSADQFVISLVEHLIGPAEGLFIYSPILLLSFLVIALKVRCKTLNTLDIGLGIIIVLHWFSISVFAGWWAGTATYGSRFFSDMIAYFIYFMIPAVAWVIERRRPLLWIIFTALVALSFYSNFYGATQQQAIMSYSQEFYPTPLWDWHYIQYLGQYPLHPANQP